MSNISRIVSINQFCTDVLNFLESKYSDGYRFTVEIWRSLCGNDLIELKVKVDNNLIIKITSVCMNYVLSLYKKNELLADSGMFSWQEKLIDLIEG